MNTCWCGEKNKNEFIILKIPYGIKGIRIFNGVAKNKELFYLNNRIKKLYIGILNKLDQIPNNYLCQQQNNFIISYQTINDSLIILKDTFEPQLIYLKTIVDWNDNYSFKYRDSIYLIIGIVDIYKGLKYNDTCISEIEIIP